MTRRPGGLTFSFSSTASQPDIDATIERLLELPAELGAEQGKSVVLVLDEFQEVGKIGADLTKLMRSVFQHQSEVSHIYLGSRRHLMEEIFNDEQEPFWRSAKQMELGPIPIDEFSRFITQRFADTGKKIEQDVIGEVLDQTGGHPYATQRLCYELWQATPKGNSAGRPEFEAAFQTVLESEHSHFGPDLGRRGHRATAGALGVGGRARKATAKRLSRPPRVAGGQHGPESHAGAQERRVDRRWP